MRSIFCLCSFLLVVSIVLSVKMSAATVTVCDETSLRAAITNGGTINFGCDGTIVLSSTLQITTNTVLDGTGHNVVLSGGDAVRVLFVATNIDFAMTNLTIAHGDQQGTNITGTQNGSPAFGAGIFNAGGRVTLHGCVLSSNTVSGGTAVYLGRPDLANGGDAAGAAIYNKAGSIWMSNSVVSGNLCRSGAGKWAADESMGGMAMGAGIYSWGGTVTVGNCEFESNVALGGTAPNAGPPYARPGAGFGGALFVEGGNVLLAQSRFANNQSAGGNILVFDGGVSGTAQGGAAYLTNCSGNISLCKFLTNSALSGSAGRYGSPAPARGGAIFNGGNLTLENDFFAGNNVAAGEGASQDSEIGGGEADGGAVFNMGFLAAIRSTITGNETRGGTGHEVMGFEYLGGDGRGGGIYNSGTFSATNITVSSNQAFGGLGSGPGRRPATPDFDPLAGAGGNGEGGGIFSQGNTILVHSTLALNGAEGGTSARLGQVFTNNPGFSLGGGIFTTNSSATLQNTIVANSLSGSNSFGVLIDDGNNLSSDASCQFTAPGSFNNTDPLLSPLGDFGGPTPTMALLAGSPAIDHGLLVYCPVTDQRGVARPSGGACDIGAFEFEANQLNVLTIEGYTNQVLHLVFAGTSGQTFQVQTSTSLSNWTSISTNTVGSNGIFDLFYTNDLSEPSRFFQVLTP